MRPRVGGSSHHERAYVDLPEAGSPRENNELCHSQAPFVKLWGETGASDGIRFCSAPILLVL